MLAMLTALPEALGGLEAGAIYIDTEGAFSSERYAAYGADLQDAYSSIGSDSFAEQALQLPVPPF